jgi:hypothetical protein
MRGWQTAHTPECALTLADASLQQLLKLKGHTGPVMHSAFSPDGHTIVTASADGTARVWKAADGQLLVTLGSASSENSAFRAEFSPDGQRIVTAGEDPAARVWNATNGQLHSCVSITLSGARATLFGHPIGSRLPSGVASPAIFRTTRPGSVWAASECRRAGNPREAQPAVSGGQKPFQPTREGVSWGANSTSLAYILMRRPVRVALHGLALLGEGS